MAIDPKLQESIAKLARHVAQSGDDPGKWIAWLLRVLEFKRTVWPTLSPETQREVVKELKRIQDECGRQQGRG